MSVKHAQYQQKKDEMMQSVTACNSMWKIPVKQLAQILIRSLKTISCTSIPYYRAFRGVPLYAK